jgi:hypothetical protein
MTARPLTKRQRFELYRAEAENEYQSWLAHWRELSDYIQPRRGRFSLGEANRGDRRSRQIIDSTGTFSARTLGSGMHAGMTSPARPWFQYGVSDPRLVEMPKVKRWLHDCTEIVLGVFGRTNLYNKLPTLYQDTGVFGTGAMIHLEDEEDISRFDTFPIGSYMLQINAKGQVRGFIRKYKMTVQQILDEFAAVNPDGSYDWHNISMTVRMLADAGNTQQTIEVVHLITENTIYDPSRSSAFRAGSQKQFVQVFYELGHDLTWPGGQPDVFLEESGFDEFPVYGFRWEVAGEDIYGTSCPGMIALGDIKQLQHGEKRGAQALDLLVRPAMKGPTSLRSSKASIITGDITYVDEANDKGGFKPVFEIRPDLDKLELKQEQKRWLIRRAFHEDLFLMMVNDNRLQPRTAREVQERHEEKLLALGPVLEQSTQDVLDPLVTRQFNICMRRRMLPPPPEVMRGKSLRVEYTSIMAAAQKMVGLVGLDRWTSSIIQVATIQPDILDNVDTDKVAKRYSEMTGVPPDLLRDPKEVAKLREARAKQEQAAQQAAIAKDQGQAAASLASADTRTPNALTDLLATVRPGATTPVS